MLKDAFLSIYGPVMRGKGFKQKGIIFHKLINNEIIQMLSLTKFRYSFTIQFCINPLCAGYEYRTFMDEERLGTLLGNEAIDWEYSGDNVMQMHETLEICQEHLFPYFDAIISYETFIPYMMKMYEVMYGDIGKKIFIKTDALYTVSLKTKDYDTAEKSMEAVIKQNEDAVENNKQFSINPAEEKIKKLEERKLEYIKMKEIMKADDRKFIEAYLETKEKYSLESYIRNFYGKKELREYQKNGLFLF